MPRDNSWVVVWTSEVHTLDVVLVCACIQWSRGVCLSVCFSMKI